MPLEIVPMNAYAYTAQNSNYRLARSLCAQA